MEKVTRLFSIGSGTTPPTDQAGYYGGDISWVTTSELRESIVTSTRKTVNEDALRSFSALRVYPQGSVVVAMYGATIGRIGYLGTSAAVNQACCVFADPKGIDAWFWFYWLQSRRPHLVSLSYGGGQPNLSQELLKSLRLPLPPLFEQRAIAAFLDCETAKIDALVAKKERLIELLQEKRTALISHDVTRGLDPDVPMKDSGVEWLGEIPEHWTGLPLKRWVATKITDGPHETPELLPNGIDFISAEAVSGGVIDFERRRGFISPELHAQYSRKCKPVRDDILICKSGATTGKLAKVDTAIDFSIWSPLALVRSDSSRISPRFLNTVLEADYVQNQIRRTWSAGTQPNISMGDIERLYVMAPNLGEQAEILAHIDEEIGGFGQLITKVREAIKRLRELRTALISAAVTGRIDVREEAGCS